MDENEAEAAWAEVTWILRVAGVAGTP